MKKDKNLKRLNKAKLIIDLCLGYKLYMDKIPAMAVGLIYKGKVILSKGYGFVDLNKKIPVDMNTCFRIASISKVFTTVSIMQLTEKDKLKLDDKISTYLPWFTSSNDSRLKNITVRQILTHTSGLTRDGDTLHWMDHNFPDWAHVKKYIASLKLPFEANSRWKYSNLGFSILGLLIEKVSGQTYEDYIQKNICKRLGMKLTSSLLNESIKKHLAVGLGRKIPGKKRSVFPDLDTKAMTSAAGISSNVYDLLKFVSAQFKGNTMLLTERSKQELRKIHWTNKKDNIIQSAGFKAFKAGKRLIYYHSGGFQGYRCNIAFDVGRSIGIVILTNVIGLDPNNFATMAFNIINYLYKQPVKQDRSDFKKYEGIYRDVWDDSAVLVLGDALVTFNPSLFYPLSHAAILTPVKKDTFMITGSEEVENAGELAKFELNKQSTARRVQWGATFADILTY